MFNLVGYLNSFKMLIPGRFRVALTPVIPSKVLLLSFNTESFSNLFTGHLSWQPNKPNLFNAWAIIKVSLILAYAGNCLGSWAPLLRLQPNLLINLTEFYLNIYYFDSLW